MLSVVGVEGSFKEVFGGSVGWEETLLVSPEVVGEALVILSVLLPPEETVCPLLLVGVVLLGELVLVLSSLEPLEIVVRLPPL